MSRSALITLVFMVLCTLYPAIAHATTPQQLPSIQRGVIDLSDWDSKSHNTIRLTGQWQFFPDQLVTPTELFRLDEPATTIHVPGAWNRVIAKKPFPHYGHGIGTYWLTFSGNLAHMPLSLLVNRSCSNAKLFFFSDRKIVDTPLTQLGRTSSVGNVASAYAGPRRINLPFTSSNTHHLLVQVSNFEYHTGGLCEEVIVGTEQGVDRLVSNTITQRTILITAIFMAALYPLAMYFQHRRDPTSIWLAWSCLCTATYFFASSGLVEQIIASDAAWVFEFRTKLTNIALMWASTSLLMFYHHNFPMEIYHRWLNLTVMLATCCTAFIIALPTWTVTALIKILVSYWVLHFIASFWILFQALKQKRPYAKPMLIAFVPVLLAIPFEIINKIYATNIASIAIYCLLFFIVVENNIIARKYTSTYKLAEKLSKHLQKEVSLQTAALNEKNRQLEQTQIALRAANHSLKRLCVTDGLTQLFNRSHFDHELEKEWRRGIRQNSFLSVVMVDVDHFKRLNDRAGHLAGDHALKQVAGLLRQHFKRAGDLVARYGGEEFSIILPNTNQSIAKRMCEQLRKHIEKSTLVFDDKLYLMTVSIGICTTKPSAKYGTKNILQAADSALYDAKKTGRNRIVTTPMNPSQADIKIVQN